MPIAPLRRTPYMPIATLRRTPYIVLCGRVDPQNCTFCNVYFPEMQNKDKQFLILTIPGPIFFYFFLSRFISSIRDSRSIFV